MTGTVTGGGDTSSGFGINLAQLANIVIDTLAFVDGYALPLSGTAAVTTISISSVTVNGTAIGGGGDTGGGYRGRYDNQ